MFAKEEKIYTEFIERSSGKLIGAADMPIDQLPDTFELETTLEIGGDKYEVQEAVPKFKEEFLKTKELKIFLNKLNIINPNDLLYSIPTIENTFFDYREVESANEFLTIHEDDWRQIEFVTELLENEINQELEGVLSIFRDKMKGQFFQEVHLRTKIPEPFKNLKIKISELESCFGIAKRLKGFKLSDNKIAVDSFAFTTLNQSFVFGLTDKDHHLKVVCFKEFNEDIKTIDSIVNRFPLIFIDWIKMKKIGK
nr:hypothetical protein [Leptospira interrogans]